jgi:RNA polymerase sigma-70 factor (ECF subfamily)
MDKAELEGRLRRVLAGEVDAYEAVVRSYQREVWKVVAAMLHDPGGTEDLVQQVFVNAYLHLFSYQPGTDFGRWIKSIARNLARNQLRARLRETRRMSVYREHLLGRLGDEAAAAREEDLLAEALRICRERLPEHGARVLDLRYARALSFEEIAAQLGRTVEAVRQFLLRIRLALRECVERRMVET